MQSIQDRLKNSGYNELIDKILRVDYCRSCIKFDDCDYKNRRMADESVCVDFEPSQKE